MSKIIFSIDTNTAGGAERVISVLVNYFSKNNHDVILVNADSDSCFYPIDARVKVLKMCLNTTPKGKLASLCRLYQKFNYMHKLLKTEKPDAVITFLFNMEFPTIVASLLARVRVFTSVRNSVQFFKKSELQIMRFLYKRIDGVVFQSNDVMNNPVFLNVKNKCVIMNPLSEELLDVSSASYDQRNNCIINVGRLQEQKNQGLLIDAFASLADDYPDIELHIFGEGPLRSALQKKIDDFHLHDRIKLEGVVKNAILNNKNARLFVLCSNYEGFPNVLVEAMAAGIPVISSNFDSGVAAEWIEPGINGELFAVGNVAEISAAIRKMLDASEKTDEMVKRSQESVKKIFPNQIGEQWDRFIFQNM